MIEKQKFLFFLTFVIAAFIGNSYLQREQVYRDFLDGFVVYSAFALPVALIVGLVYSFVGRLRR